MPRANSVYSYPARLEEEEEGRGERLYVEGKAQILGRVIPLLRGLTVEGDCVHEVGGERLCCFLVWRRKGSKRQVSG